MTPTKLPLMDKKLAIVLTATLIPNAILTVHTDFEQRRAAYLKAIDFYHPYAEVYFLENSTYDLASDAAFHQYANVHIRKFPPSKFYAKGKGFQEFEMLDLWLGTEPSAPVRWLKITGRHRVNDFDKVFAECLNEDQYELIIEQERPPHPEVLTNIFYVTTAYYRRRFLGIYRLADDAAGVFIEHIVLQHIQLADKFRLFKHLPLTEGISGSTGEVFGITLKRRLKRLLGKLTYRFNNQYRIF